eukprot:TRINITY_DN14026_c0_g1_i1.p2 TRINITY_DN14026_c0_g1~~TRINITY_DN14026_c0_g1_i1.p2  ORF type:complete len:157 (-),score=35.87 TRINITY_DN14026_c0_g1_i1:108-518(-)
MEKFLVEVRTLARVHDAFTHREQLRLRLEIRDAIRGASAESGNDSEPTAPARGTARRGRASRRAHSRNPYIDEILAETGEKHDTYADLEDFIVVPVRVERSRKSSGKSKKKAGEKRKGATGETRDAQPSAKRRKKV